MPKILSELPFCDELSKVVESLALRLLDCLGVFDEDNLSSRRKLPRVVFWFVLFCCLFLCSCCFYYYHAICMFAICVVWVFTVVV